MKRAYYYLVLPSAILFVGQLITGTQIVVAFLFSLAIYFGLCASFATGSWHSTLGLLNLIIISKFLIFGIVVKTLFLQPADDILLAPVETSMVAALGYAGVLIGTIIQQRLPLPRTRLIYAIADKNFYLVLYVFLMIAGYGSWSFIYISRQQAADVTTTIGGPFGFLTGFSEIRELAISACLYYVWLSKSRKFLSHPLVIFTLVVSTLLGIYSTSKEAMIEPAIYLFFTAASIKGIRYKPIWIILIVGSVTYATIIAPFSNFIRNAGGLNSVASERITVMTEVIPKMIFDEEFRNSVNTTLEKTVYKKFQPYLPVAGYSLGRMALVAEADRLIAASTNTERTGWETINWGFQMVLPRFMNPDKPYLATNNYLAHKVGEVGATDYTTQVSYGFMANFYNAFDFPGVIIGSSILICSLYYWLTLFFGNPTNLNIWSILVFGTYNHSLSEQSVAGIIASIWFPVTTLIVFLLAKHISKLLPW